MIESYPQAVEWIRDFRAKFDVTDPVIDDEATAHLARLSAWNGPAAQAMSLWGSVLVLCVKPFPVDPPSALRTFVIEVARRVNDDQVVGGGRALRGSILAILEFLVLAALVVEEPSVATRALRRWASTVNAEFVDAQLGPRFLSTRLATGALRDAAHLAHKRGEYEWAVEAAEAGRLKLLAAVAAGSPADGDTNGGEDPEIELSGTHAERLHELIGRPSRAAAEELIKANEVDLAKLLRTLATPWQRLVPEALSDALATRLTFNPINDVIWNRALREPTLAWLVATLQDHQLLIYPFLTAERVGCVACTRGESMSFQMDRSELPPDAVHARILGAHLPDACAAAFGAVPGHPEWTDVRVVDWDNNQTEDAQAVALGYALAPLRDRSQVGTAIPTVIPSARILPPSQKGLVARHPEVTFIGDPTKDLPGPWLEASAWHSRYGDAVELHLGSAATCARALEAFRTSPIVIISGHTFGIAGREHFGIRLCDGTLTHQDLLKQGEIASRQVVLSCCSAAAAVREKAADEVLGLVTTLLAIGARQVLAPIVPVRDAPCAVLGVAIADTVASGTDLRHAFGNAIHVISPRDRGQEVLTVPHVLPDALLEICPHDESLLRARASATRAEAFETLLHFSVFGGGSVTSDEARDATG